LEKYKSEIPKLEDINNELVFKLKKLQDELDKLKTIVESTEKKIIRNLGEDIMNK